MKAFIGNDKFVGTPEEIASFVKRLKMVHKPTTHVTSPDMLSPKAAYFNQGEQEALRRKLAEDPNYNPYGGVVPSKETITQQEEQRPYAADIDTGVSYEI